VTDTELLPPDELERRLRAIGEERYHIHHPFHHLLHGGKLTRPQVQAWALNRYYYQASIPAKDAAVLGRLPTPELRREWRRRIVDHDGDGDRLARDERQACGDGALHIFKVFGAAHHEFELLNSEASHVVHAKVAVTHQAHRHVEQA
jgi:hypothetical protein